MDNEGITLEDFFTHSIFTYQQPSVHVLILRLISDNSLVFKAII